MAGDATEAGYYRCETCGFIYVEADGDPETGVPPGTAWADLPDDWCCPQCGSDKSNYTHRTD